MAEAPRTQNPRVIRLAFLGGVLMFGAVSYVVQHGDNPPPRPSAEAMQTLRYVGYGLWAAVITGLIALRLVFARLIERGSNPQLSLGGWALGEMLALFGGVYYFQTNDFSLYVSGIVAMLATFALFPVPRT
jgi:hypothetical protein